MRLARDGFREMATTTLTLGVGGGAATWAALSLSALWWIAALPLLGFWLFTIAFFRDPHRRIPTEPGLLVSPADGRVTEVTRLDKYPDIDGPVVRIGIFLSVFDVHINRTPCDARVIRTQHHPGEFLDARHPESGVRNEAVTTVMAPESPVTGPMVVRQVAGFLARRIVCRAKAGDRLQRGERFGLIKFGSRTELILPDVAGLSVDVTVGDVVRGGSTILARVACDAAGVSTTQTSATTETDAGATRPDEQAAAVSDRA